MHLPPCRPALLPPGRRSALLPPCRPALLPAPQLCYCQPRTRSPTPELLHAPHPQPHTRATACPSPPHPSPPPLPPGDPHRGQHQPSLIPCWPVPDGLTPTGGCLGGGGCYLGGGGSSYLCSTACVCVRVQVVEEVVQRCVDPFFPPASQDMLPNPLTGFQLLQPHSFADTAKRRAAGAGLGVGVGVGGAPRQGGTHFRL